MCLNDSPKRPAAVGTAVAVLAAVVTDVVVAVAAGFGVAVMLDDIVRDGWLVLIPFRSLKDGIVPLAFMTNVRSMGNCRPRGVDVRRSRPQACCVVVEYFASGPQLAELAIGAGTA